MSTGLTKRHLLLGTSSLALMGMASAGQKSLLLSGAGKSGPVVGLDFTKGVSQLLTTVRAAGGATYFDSTGTLQLAAANTQRIDYGYSGGAIAKGLLVEEQRVNNVRNPRAEGVVAGVAGSGGTGPTFWGNYAFGGCTTTWVGNGYENGVPYVDLSVVGTPTASGQYAIAMDSTVTTAASTAWTASWYCRLLSGNLTNISNLRMQNNFSPSGTFITVNAAPTTASLSAQRNTATATSGVSDTTVQPNLVFSYTVNLPISFTIRIGAPQLELGAFATSPILPPVGTPGATLRSADQVTMPFSLKKPAISFVVQANFPVNNNPTYAGLLHIDDGSVSSRFEMYNQASANNTLMLSTLANTNSVQPILGTMTPGVNFKAGGSFTPGSQITAFNGVAGATTNTVNLPSTQLTTLRVGQSSIGGGYSGGWIKNVKVWKRALSVQELLQQTT